jgi:FixJ family two-component response regulator
MRNAPVVCIVDDDEAVRETLQQLVESIDIRVKTYASPQHYLDFGDPNLAGCLVLDIRMPGMSGLELHETLISQGCTLPVIIITGYGDVSSAVRAMRQGAVDFLEKPFHNQILLDLIQHCIQRDAQNRQAEAARHEVCNNLSKLTPREREVLDLVVSGKSNKETARSLDISPKTVEVHRSRVMEKMEATSLPKLVQMMGALEDHQGSS